MLIRNFQVPTTVEPWVCSSPRRASVNSFGYGGANVHAILESAEDFLNARGVDPVTFTRKSAFAITAVKPVLDLGLDNHHIFASINCRNGISNGHTKGHTNGHLVGNGHSQNDLDSGHEYDHSITNGYGVLAEPKSRSIFQTRLFALSAFDPTAGEAWTGRLVEYVSQRHDVTDAAFLDSLAFTLSNRRTIHSWKAVVAASSSLELISRLKNAQFVNVPPKRNLGFVFTGQGAQWCGMGKELIGAFPSFRKTLEECGAALVRLGAPFDVLGCILTTPLMRKY